MAALVIHVAVLELFLKVLKMGIYSVVFANIIFALVMCLLNARTIEVVAGYDQEYKKSFLLPTVCALLMGAAAYGVYRGVELILPSSLMRGRLGMALVVLPAGGGCHCGVRRAFGEDRGGEREGTQGNAHGDKACEDIEKGPSFVMAERAAFAVFAAAAGKLKKCD